MDHTLSELTVAVAPLDDVLPAPADGTSVGPLVVPTCERGIGDVIQHPDARSLIDGVRIAPYPLFSDDRGYFFEVMRSGGGLAADFPLDTTQVSTTLSYSGTIKAFHYHCHQTDCWVPAHGTLQVALVDLRIDSPTYGRRNTLYVGVLRPWQVLIPPGVAHGYKAVGPEPVMLVYVTSRFYNPFDEGRIAFDDRRINYDWSVQHK
jgi:dTDP-4-dehydrorhamnose 3,5-epimerase